MASGTIFPLLGVNPCVRLRITAAMLFGHLVRGYGTLGETGADLEVWWPGGAGAGPGAEGVVARLVTDEPT